MNHAAIGRAIRERRLARDPKLTLSELARQVGVSTPTAWGWENGKHGASIAHLMRVAAVLDCTVNDLVGGSPDGSGGSESVAA